MFAPCAEFLISVILPSIPSDEKQHLLEKQKKLQESINFIDWKQNFYDDVLSGKTEYVSNLIDVDE